MRLKKFAFSHIIAFILVTLPTISMESIIASKDSQLPYFYRIEKDDGNPPLYLLGSCHVVPPEVLSSFILDIFEGCGTFITETLEYGLPNYFEVHLENMKKLGFGVDNESLLQRDLECCNFSSDEYKQQFCEDWHFKYITGWASNVKKPSKLKEVIEANGLTLESVNKMHPLTIAFGVLGRLKSEEEQKNGMDNVFLKKANTMHKLVEGLETDLERSRIYYDSVIRDIDTFSLDGKKVFVPLSALLEVVDKKLEELLNLSMPEAQLSLANIISEMTTLYLAPEEMEKILDTSECAVIERNDPWFHKLEELLEKAAKPLFGCVGLNHVKDLLSRFKKKGYRVIQATKEGFVS